jgi:hypothetical protein
MSPGAYLALSSQKLRKPFFDFFFDKAAGVVNFGMWSSSR